jgi:hypothetical protein
MKDLIDLVKKTMQRHQIKKPAEIHVSEVGFWPANYFVGYDIGSPGGDYSIETVIRVNPDGPDELISTRRICGSHFSTWTCTLNSGHPGRHNDQTQSLATWED